MNMIKWVYTATLIDVVVRVLVYRGKRGGADNW